MFKNLHNMSANYLKIELRRLHMLMQLKITFDVGGMKVDSRDSLRFKAILATMIRECILITVHSSR